MNYIKSKKSKVRNIALGLVLVISITQLQTVTASKITDAQNKKNEAESELGSVQGEIGAIEDKQAVLQTEIDQLDSELVSVIMNLNILESDLDKKQEQLTKVKKELKKAKKDEKTQYEAMKTRIQFMYERGDTAFLTTVLESESITELLNRVEFFNEVYDYDRELLVTYQSTKLQVAQLKLDVQGEIAEMEEMQLNFQDQQKQYETLLAEKKNQVADFDTKLASAQDLAARYQAMIEEQNNVIRQEEERLEQERIARERAEKEQAERARAAAAAAASGSSSGAGSNGSNLGGNLDPGFTTGGGGVVDYAMSFVGNPYVWGGTDPNTGADCSGFVQYVYRKFGVSLPRTSGEQRSAGKEVSYANAKPGDLICYSGHIAIYMGNGQIVHASSSAPYPVGGIKTGTATYRTIIAVRRVL